MKERLLLVGLLLQLGLALGAFIWQLAFLGFAHEAHRSHSTNRLGKCLLGLCLVVGAVPIGLSLWVGWCYYFSPTAWKQLPLGYLLPLGEHPCLRVDGRWSDLSLQQGWLFSQVKQWPTRVQGWPGKVSHKVAILYTLKGRYAASWKFFWQAYSAECS